jgi:hypothetical protein
MRKTNFVMPPDFSNETTERLVYILPQFRRRFNKLATKMFRKVTSLWEELSLGRKLRKLEHTICTNLSLVFQVTFVRDDNNGNLVVILHSQDLLVEGVDFLERVARSDRIYK